MRKPLSASRLLELRRWARVSACVFVAAWVLVGWALGGREVHAETMTCLGACRVEYGACLMEAKNMDPAAADAHRTECGKGYLRCSKRCKEATP